MFRDFRNYLKFKECLEFSETIYTSRMLTTFENPKNFQKWLGLYETLENLRMFLEFFSMLTALNNFQ